MGVGRGVSGKYCCKNLWDTAGSVVVSGAGGIAAAGAGGSWMFLGVGPRAGAGGGVSFLRGRVGKSVPPSVGEYMFLLQ